MSRHVPVGHCPECAAYIVCKADHDPHCPRYIAPEDGGTDR